MHSKLPVTSKVELPNSDESDEEFMDEPHWGEFPESDPNIIAHVIGLEDEDLFLYTNGYTLREAVEVSFYNPCYFLNYS